MPRSSPEILNSIVQSLIATGPEAPALDRKRAMLADLRAVCNETADQAVLEVLRAVERMGKGLQQARSAIAELRQQVELLVGKLWYPAIFLDFVGEPAERRALVFQGNATRVVGVWEALDPVELSRGAEVMLNTELSSIVAASPRDLPPTGEIADVVEKTDRGSLIVRSHEQEYEVSMAEALEEEDLKPSDRVRWHPQAQIAIERVAKSQSRRFLMGETPNVPLDAVGGQDENLARLLNSLTAVLAAPDMAAEYRLNGRCSVLLVGPSGCGKTLLVKAVVSEIARRTGRSARFFVVRPAEWEHWLVGASERNVRELFDTLRDSAKDGTLTVVLLDEVECVGRIRGHVQGHHSDKTLNALLHELDGLSGRDGVAVVATTNRKDLIDSALLQRLSDEEIAVRRPDMNGARAIFAIHLGASLPFSPNGSMAAETRSQIIETAVARFYHPNSRYAELARLKFRDGSTRVVCARDFACGRLFEQIARSARMLAYQRQLRTGERGLQVADMEEALAGAMERLSTTVTIFNARDQIHDLPTDNDVVAVERIPLRVDRPHRYRTPALVEQKPEVARV